LKESLLSEVREKEKSKIILYKKRDDKLVDIKRLSDEVSKIEHIYVRILL